MNKITPELSEILGLLCAEGSHIVSFSSYWGKDRGKKRFYKNDKSERIELYNKDIKLLVHYQNLLNQQYGYYPKITKYNKINICKMVIIRDIISYTNLGSFTWKVPEAVKTGDLKCKTAFIRGLFDGDGSAVNGIRFFSSNKKGIYDISALLGDLGFKHTMRGPILKENRKPHYVLRVTNKQKENFLNLIKPISKIPDTRG